jgi:hypothetical protein
MPMLSAQTIVAPTTACLASSAATPPSRPGHPHWSFGSRPSVAQWMFQDRPHWWPRRESEAEARQRRRAPQRPPLIPYAWPASPLGGADKAQPPRTRIKPHPKPGWWSAVPGSVTTSRHQCHTD